MKRVDDFRRVMAVRPGDHVVMLAGPRVVQAVQEPARGRGATLHLLHG
jgi:hypothetical protein